MTYPVFDTKSIQWRVFAMKKILTKRKKIGNCKSMISGGWGRYGLYIYSGLKTRWGAFVGASAGTRGRELYAGINNKVCQVRLKFNMDTMSLIPRIRMNKKHTTRRKKR